MTTFLQHNWPLVLLGLASGTLWFYGSGALRSNLTTGTPVPSRDSLSGPTLSTGGASSASPHQESGSGASAATSVAAEDLDVQALSPAQQLASLQEVRACEVQWYESVAAALSPAEKIACAASREEIDAAIEGLTCGVRASQPGQHDCRFNAQESCTAECSRAVQARAQLPA